MPEELATLEKSLKELEKEKNVKLPENNNHKWMWKYCKILDKSTEKC